ncbi:MAG: hypothetical protein RLZZ238_1533 [Planctomycetota bacterium]
MPFRSGSISYRRFAVTGAVPNLQDEALVRSLRESVLGDLEPMKPGEIHVGFTGGRHLFDRSFAYEHIAFGSGMHLGARIDTVRVPPDIKKAYISMAEEARLQPSKDGLGAALPRGARAEAREDAMRRIEDEIGEGRYRRSKHLPIYWDFSNSTLYGAIKNDAEIASLRTLFLEQLSAKIEPRSAGRLALDLIAAKGRTSDYDDLRAQPLSSPPAEIELVGEDGARKSPDRPDIPWASQEPQDFLGNLFLFWLWWHCETREGLVETPEGEISVVIDKVLELECAWGLSGRTSVRGDAPTRKAEAARAVQLGKWPRKVGLMLSMHGRVWECTLQGDRFEVSGLKLPKPDEKPQSLRLAIEERFDSFATFDAALMSMYRTFVGLRMSPAWETCRAEMRNWIGELGATRKMIAVGV